MTRHLVPSLACILALASGETLGAEKVGVSMADQTKVGDQPLVLNGLGIREATIFAVDVYVAGLYVPKKSSDPRVLIDPETPKKLVLHFVREVDKDDIVDAFREGFEKTGGATKAMKPRVERLLQSMASMKVKDRMVFSYIPGQGLSVTVKNQGKGTLPGKDFIKSFLLIWLGEDPPNEELKAGLLGQDED